MSKTFAAGSVLALAFAIAGAHAAQPDKYPMRPVRVITGSVGALVGAARCASRGARQSRARVTDSPDPLSFTAPHGDKLRVAR